MATKRKSRKSRSTFMLVIGVSLGVRLIWIFAVDAYPNIDAYGYYERAVSLSGGNPDFESYWPIGYPWILAGIMGVFGDSVRTAQVVNAVAYCGMLTCLYALSREWFHSRLLARVAVVAMAFYPNHIYYSAAIWTETVFLFLMIAGFASMFWKRHPIIGAVLAGGIFSLATMVRPQAILLPAVLIPWLAPSGTSRRDAWKSIALRGTWLYMVLLIGLVPLTVYNHAKYGRWFLVSTNGGKNLFVGNNPYATGQYTNEGFRRIETKNHGAYALRYMRENPGRVIALIPRKLWYMFRDDTCGLGIVLSGQLPSSIDASTYERFLVVYASYHRVVKPAIGLRALDRVYLLDAETGEYRLNSGSTDLERARALQCLTDAGMKGLGAREFNRYAALVLALIARTAYVLVGAMFGVFLFRLATERYFLQRVGRRVMCPLAVIVYFVALHIVFFGTTRFHFPLIPMFLLPGLAAWRYPRRKTRAA